MPGLADFRAASAAIRSRLHWPLSVGITGRLTFSFVAVAILAAAANLIAEHGVAVIRTRHFDRGLATPPTLPAPQAAAPAIIDAPRPPPPQPLPINSDLFMAAIERYQRAV